MRLALTLREGMVGNGPVTPELEMRLAHIKSYLAQLKLLQGDLGESERLCRETIAHVEPLGRQSPDVVEYARRLSLANKRFGVILWEMGRLAESEECFGDRWRSRSSSSRGIPALIPTLKVSPRSSPTWVNSSTRRTILKRQPSASADL